MRIPFSALFVRSFFVNIYRQHHLLCRRSAYICNVSKNAVEHARRFSSRVYMLLTQLVIVIDISGKKFLIL